MRLLCRILNPVCLLLLAGVLLLPESGVHAEKRYAVTIDSLPHGAEIYLEAKEAGGQGQTPHTFSLKRGTYTFILEAPGYHELSKTVRVKRKSTFTFTLEKQQVESKPEPANVRVEAAPGSAAEGAAVLVNGKHMGKVPLSLTLQSGRYLIEVRKEGYRSFQEWVDAAKGEKRNVIAKLTSETRATGSLLVASNIQGAEVYLDGRKVDTTPTLLEELQPGKHNLEVAAKGYVSVHQEVEIAAGRTLKVALELKPDEQAIAAAGGTLLVLANQKNVQLFVDGETKGQAPVKIEGLVEGSHLIEARKEGMTSIEQSVAIKKGEFKTIKLELQPVEPPKRTGGIRVISPIQGASVYIDGSLMGKTPLVLEKIVPGPHFVSVRLQGYEDLIQTVEVTPGSIVQVKAALVAIPTPQHAQEPKSPAQAQAQVQAQATVPAQGMQGLDIVGQSSYGAQLVPPGYFSGDLSVGFPYVFEGRLTAGLFSRNNLGMDGGVDFRTYGAVTEIGAHASVRLVSKAPLALAALVALGGGGGPSSRNTFYTNFGLIGSMWFKQLVTFSARALLNFYTDRHCPANPETGELAVCKVSQDVYHQNPRSRFDGARLILSAILEVPLSRRVNLFFIFEGAPFQGNRRAFSDPFAEIMPTTDPGLYGRLGATFKY